MVAELSDTDETRESVTDEKSVTGKAAPGKSYTGIWILVVIVVGLIGFGVGRVPTELRRELSRTLHWGSPTEVEVSLIWRISNLTRDTTVHTTTQALTFIKADVLNRTDATVSIRSIWVLFQSRSDITIHTMKRSIPVDIGPGETETIDLQEWIPAALLRDITDFSARLSYDVATD